MRYEKIHYQWPIAEYTFFDCHSSFSLVKAAMNALRICKMWNVLAKCSQFLLFSTAQVCNEYSP
jgi:hypothetical protein